MKYLLETPHTKEECLRELDEVLGEGKEVLNEFYWGCKAGDHTGYAIVEGRNESEIKGMVPEFLRGKAKIVELTKFTPEQIRALH